MNKYFLPATFLLGTIVLLFVYSKGVNNGRSTATTGSGKVPYMQVKQYQQETAMKIGIKKDQARFRKNSATGLLAPAENKQGDYDDYDLSPEENVGSDIVSEDSYQQAVTLDQQMDNFLAKKQKFNELESMKKKKLL